MIQLPPKGFYQHYKHDPAGAPHNYMYEVVGIVRHTEDDSLAVLYRPLYESAWMPPADYNVRPLEMFMETVEKDGAKIPRFTHLTDPALVAELSAVRDQMYSNQN